MRLVNKTDVGQRRVYDIEVEDVHNFYANGVNVHNCATAGGVSVIKDDGTVVDSASTGSTRRVAFSDDGLWYTLDSVNVHDYFATYADITAGDGFGDLVVFSTIRPYLAYSAGQSGLVINGKGQYWKSGPKGASNLGVMSHLPDYSDFDNGMVFVTTSTYNTGWMPSDIKGAFLSDTDDTDLVGSGELVTNGTFDTDVSGWTVGNANGDPTTATIAHNSGRLQLNLDIIYDGAFSTITGLAVGKTYVLQGLAIAGTYSGSMRLAVSGLANGFVSSVMSGGNADLSLTFTATSTSHTILFAAYGLPVSGQTVFLDNVSVKEADADRSVNNGLIVNGTVTRSPVATGADLVAYSGFSASNYLEQPYNSDLDFGTGDFCVMGWVAPPAAGVQKTIFSKGPVGTNTSPYFEYRLDADNTIKWVGNNSTSRLGTTALTAGLYYQVVFVRASGVGYLYLNGVLQDSATNTDNYNHSNADIMRVGFRHDGGATAFNGSLALLRISATAPTPEQIAKIYEDEKVLFQENAQATLYGTSDAVTALAHDDATNLLHVGTSAGRSVFQGLRRVSNTTTAVGTAISASNGLIAEE